MTAENLKGDRASKKLTQSLAAKGFQLGDQTLDRKPPALATLRSVIDNLGLGLTTPDEGSPVEQVKAPGRWEAQPNLKMAFLTVTDYPDSWN